MTQASRSESKGYYGENHSLRLAFDTNFRIALCAHGNMGTYLSCMSCEVSTWHMHIRAIDDDLYVMFYKFSEPTIAQCEDTCISDHNDNRFRNERD